MRPVRPPECHTGYKCVTGFIPAVEIRTVVWKRLGKIYMFLLEILDGKLLSFSTFHHLAGNKIFQHRVGFGAQTYFFFINFLYSDSNTF